MVAAAVSIRARGARTAQWRYTVRKRGIRTNRLSVHVPYRWTVIPMNPVILHPSKEEVVIAKRGISIASIVAVLAAVTLSACRAGRGVGCPACGRSRTPACNNRRPRLRRPHLPEEVNAHGEQSALPPDSSRRFPPAAPSAGKPLPDPKSQPVAPGRRICQHLRISTDELEVKADRGCPSQYKLNDPIQFIGVRGLSTTSGYWMYMEIWNSTNDAWWTKLASNWVEPGGSISRSGRIVNLSARRNSIHG